MLNRSGALVRTAEQAVVCGLRGWCRGGFQEVGNEQNDGSCESYEYFCFLLQQVGSII